MSRWQRAFLRTNHTEVSVGPEEMTFQPMYGWVILALASYATHETGHDAYPGSERLKSTTGVSTASIGRALRWAKQAGWVEQVAAAMKGHHPAEFHLTFPAGVAFDRA